MVFDATSPSRCRFEDVWYSAFVGDAVVGPSFLGVEALEQFLLVGVEDFGLGEEFVHVLHLWCEFVA